MAARGQLQNFFGALKLQNLKKEIILFIFKVLLKFKMAAMDKLHIFLCKNWKNWNQ